MYVVIFIVAVIAYLYLYFIWNNNYWKKRDVPHDKPDFFFGNLKGSVLATKHFSMIYTDLYRKYKQYPYCGYFRLRDPSVVINDPELIKNVLLKDFASFANNEFQVDYNIDPIWGSNAFVQIGEKWKKTRALWTSSLTVSRIKMLYEGIDKTCDVMVDYLKRFAKENKDAPIESRKLSSKFFTDAMVTSIFGLELNSFENPENAYAKLSNAMFQSTFLEGLITLLFNLAPTLAKFLKLRFVTKEMQDELIVMAKELLNHRNKNGFQRNNPLDSILLQRGDKSVTELEVAGIIFGFLLDGTETSSNVGGFMLYALAANPKVQAKLREEIDEAYRTNDGKLNYDIIHGLPYLDMVLTETMRLYPPLPSSQRICTKKYDLPPITPGGKPVEIPVGATVVIPVYGLQMDPDYYPEPEKFIPERFSEENKASIPKYTYLPFGDGPRICLGTRLAINQLKILMVALVRNFEINLAPKMIGKPIQIDPNIFVYRNIGDLWITLKSR